LWQWAETAMRSWDRPPNQSARFLAWVAGIDQLLLGLAILVTPAQFEAGRYAAFQSHLAVYGALLGCSGLLLLLSQVLPFRRRRFSQLPVLVGAFACILLALGFIQSHNWGSVPTFGVLAAALVVAAAGGHAWLRSRLHLDLFLSTVAVAQLLSGGLVLLVPGAFAGSALTKLPLYLPLAAGALLCGCAILDMRTANRWGRLCAILPLAAGALLLIWAYELGVRGNFVLNALTTSLLAIGIAMWPFIPSAWFSPARVRIANKLMSASLLSVGTAFVVIVVVLLQRTESAYEQRSQLDLTTTAAVIAHDSASFLKTEVAQATFLSRDPEVLSFDPDLQLPFVQRVLRGDPTVSQISIVNRDGITVVRSTGEQPNIDRRPQLGGVAEVFRTHQPQWDVEVSQTQQVPVLVVRVPIFDKDGSFDGVYVHQVRLSTLTANLGQLPLDKTGRIVIVDAQGRVVVHPDPGLVARQADLSQLPPVAATLAGRSLSLVYRDGDRRWLSGQAHVPELGWTVLVERPEAVVLGPANRAREQALGFLAVMLALFAATAFFLARGFTRPLADLVRATHSLGMEEAEAELPPAGDDEVGDLVHAFQDMRDRLSARTREREAAEAERAQLLIEEQAARTEAETLADIGRGISASLDLDEVLRTTAESGRRLVDADLTAIALTDSRRRLPLAAVVGNRTPLLSNLIIPADRGGAGEVLAHGRPYQTHWDGPGDGLSRYSAAVEAMAAEGVLSTLAVPIHYGSETVGVFWVHSRTHREFTPAEIALLDRLAAQAGAAVANARAHAEVEALLVATAKLGEKAEPEEVLRTLVEEAGKLLEAERSVYAVLRDGRLIIPADFRDGEWFADGHEARRHGILWSVWDSGRAYRVDDVAKDPNSSPERVKLHRAHFQLTVPLRGPDGENLGLISLNNRRGASAFSERDERLLTGFCETGAVILSRANETAARLVAEQSATRSRQEVEALLAAADQLNSALEPEEVLRRVVRTAAELLAVKRVGIATNEGDHAMRRHTWLDGIWHSVQTRLPLTGSVSGWVITHAKPYRSDDLAASAQVFRQALPAALPERALAVPILGRDGRVLGSLNLFDRLDGNSFSNEDQRLAEGIAHHAAMAMERAQLIQELQAREQRLQEQAVTDPLTGLPNRRLFLERLSHALTSGRRRARGVSVLFLDLDGFKVVNDSLGHAAGDDLLQEIGHRLTAFCRKNDSVARFGGDEFAILLTDLEILSDATGTANRLVEELRRPLTVGRQRTLSITASVGVSVRGPREEGRSAEELMREADIALYRAKAEGKAHAVMFVPSMNTEALERLELQTDLGNALENGELHVYYQPLVDLEAKSIIGAEALLRWQHPRYGLLPPHAFIPLAEETGAILPIGRWVLEEACRQVMKWRAQLPRGAPFRMSVNVSPVQLQQPEFVAQVASSLRQAGMDSDGLQLEITETAFVHHAEPTIAKLTALRELGVHLAIDDFGTGYSSLSYLRRLPVDTVKIDQSFMQDFHHGSSTAAIVRAVIALAHALNMTVTAEGIETADQLVFLAALDCDHGQGFYFARPCAASEFELLLRDAFPDTYLPTTPATGRPQAARSTGVRSSSV
jgi:diguanylate cyclase (GGDEF)-like protein